MRRRVPYTTPGRRRVPFAIALAAVLLAVATIAAIRTVRSQHSAPIVEDDPPVSYRIVYDVTQDGTKLRQTLTVRRPYDARNAIANTAIVTTAGKSWRIDPTGDPVDLGDKAPSTPAGDARPALALRDALRANVAKRAGTSRIAGRRCERFAVAQPLGSPLLAPGPITRTELCIDRRGLVLEERWTKGRTLARLRRARSVETNPKLETDVFLENRAERHAPQAGDELRAVRVDPGGAFHLDVTDVVAGTLVDAYVDGPGLLLVEQTQSDGKPWPGSAIAKTVKLADGRSGELILDLVASQLRVDLGNRRWLRLSGSVSPDTLVRVARTIKAI